MTIVDIKNYFTDKSKLLRKSNLEIDVYLLILFILCPLNKIELLNKVTGKLFNINEKQSLNISLINFFIEDYKINNSVYDEIFSELDISPSKINNWLHGELAPYMDIGMYTPTTKENKHLVH